MSVTFEPVDSLSPAHLGVLWHTMYASDFPIAETKAPSAAPIEQFPRSRPSLSLEVSQLPPEPRLWFMNSTRERLIQVQNGWFASNWRKLGISGEYPHYESSIRDQFESQLERLVEFVKQAAPDSSPPHFIQCEITYLNLIEPGPVWKDHGQIDRVIKVMVDPSRDFLPEPEESNLQQAFIIRRTNRNDPIGRLRIDVKPAFRRSDETPVVRLALTARGAPFEDSLEGVMNFLDLGREWIVRGFVDITTDEMQQEWRRTK